MDSNQFNILDIYRRYCVIMSGRSAPASEDTMTDDNYELARLQSRKSLADLVKCVESRVRVRNTIFDEICFLMSTLDVTADFGDFSSFYDFVFFISLENGGKCISVSRAVTNWRLVLDGRFRLLNLWCDFVEKYHRHGITEDTWRQVLVFSHFCAEGSIEGYDPQGSWPVLIDDFMEHLNSHDKNPIQLCNNGNSEAMSIDDNHLNLKLFNDSGLKNCIGLKRKQSEDFDRHGLEPSCNQYVYFFYDSNKRGKKP